MEATLRTNLGVKNVPSLDVLRFYIIGKPKFVFSRRSDY